MAAKADAPRWEWRTFGADLSAIRAKIGPASDGAARRSEEIYLLNAATPHSAKIRDGALEIKRLLRVDGNGLELWNPAFRAEFPLSAQRLAEAFSALAIQPAPMPPKDYGVDAFLGEIVAPSEALRAVPVKKARSQFVFLDCGAEFTRLRVGARNLESFAVESVDEGRVLSALRELGLDSRLNICFPKGIERALALVD